MSNTSMRAFIAAGSVTYKASFETVYWIADAACAMLAEIAALPEEGTVTSSPLAEMSLRLKISTASQREPGIVSVSVTVPDVVAVNAYFTVSVAQAVSVVVPFTSFPSTGPISLVTTRSLVQSVEDPMWTPVDVMLLIAAIVEVHSVPAAAVAEEELTAALL